MCVCVKIRTFRSVFACARSAAALISFSSALSAQLLLSGMERALRDADGVFERPRGLLVRLISNVAGSKLTAMFVSSRSGFFLLSLGVRVTLSLSVTSHFHLASLLAVGLLSAVPSSQAGKHLILPHDPVSSLISSLYCTYLQTHSCSFNQRQHPLGCVHRWRRSRFWVPVSPPGRP